MDREKLIEETDSALAICLKNMGRLGATLAGAHIATAIDAFRLECRADVRAVDVPLDISLERLGPGKMSLPSPDGLR